MDTRQLLYFRAVVDNGSFTHAAESLDMTQPSLSLSIRKLEKELNAQLLSRGGNRVGALLFDELGLPATVKTPTGAPSSADPESSSTISRTTPVRLSSVSAWPMVSA